MLALSSKDSETSGKPIKVENKVAVVVAVREIHIVDLNSRRRAQLAFDLNGQGYHAHVYESIDELACFEVERGLILLSGDDDLSSSTPLAGNQLARGSTPVAFYSSKPKPSAIVKAMLAGALDYLTFPLEDESALKELVVRAQHTQKVMERRAKACTAVALLSDREREVLVSLVEGLSNKAIAIQLGISPRTVEIHRSNVLRKLEVESSTGAVRIGIYAGLDDIETAP